MTSRTKTAIGIAALTALAALGFWILNLLMVGDEDRPPIIVRGGSLEFENGTDDRPGFDWEHSPLGFRMKHDQGRAIGKFQLYFTGGAGNCNRRAVTDFTVIYAENGTGPGAAYEVRARRSEPSISGPKLEIDSTNSKKLRVDGTSKDFTIVGVNWECSNPTEVIAEPLK